jgi:hypothetical protein
MQRVIRTVRGLSPEEAAALLERAGIDTAARPEVLTPEQFAGLFELI